MQSPIPNAFWSNLFQGVVATTTTLALVSMYREKRNAGVEPIAPALKELRSRELDYDTAAGALSDILDALEAEARAKKGVVKLAVRERGIASLLVKMLKFDADAVDESARICSIVFKIVGRAFSDDATGRDAWAAAGGHKKLLSLVSVAHRDGHTKLMEEAAQALREVCVVDEDEMNLPVDVPAGSKGALELATYPATQKMLRVLSKSARTPFLVQIAAVFASICTLRAGGLFLSKGIDNKSGAAIFLDLIDPRGNQLLSEYCVRTIHWMSIHDKEIHHELAEASNVAKIVDLLEPMQTTNTVHSLLGLVASLSHHGASKAFLTEFMAANGPTALIRLWCKADEKETRDRAETIVRILSRHPIATDEIGRLLEMHRSMLMERRARDEEVQRKAQMQQRQQQMMQQQMMMQMAQSGQLPPGMMDEE